MIIKSNIFSTLNVDANTTLNTVKGMLEIEEPTQMLIYNGMVLDEEDKTLSEYGIESDGTLEVHDRFLGGQGNCDCSGYQGGGIIHENYGIIHVNKDQSM